MPCCGQGPEQLAMMMALSLCVSASSKPPSPGGRAAQPESAWLMAGVKGHMWEPCKARFLLMSTTCTWWSVSIQCPHK